MPPLKSPYPELPYHAIPHLKALISVFLRLEELGCGSTFTLCHTLLKKKPFLFHKIKVSFELLKSVCKNLSMVTCASKNSTTLFTLVFSPVLVKIKSFRHNPKMHITFPRQYSSLSKFSAYIL